jgi:hypothetical protein
VVTTSALTGGEESTLAAYAGLCEFAGGQEEEEEEEVVEELSFGEEVR